MKKATTTRKTKDATTTQLAELLYQALETELGGVEVYTTALQCVQNEELRTEWEKYLEQTKRHVEILREVCEGMGLDPDRDTPGRQVVRTIGKALVKAMQISIGAGDAAATEIVAAECVVHAETKDHMNWSLIGKLVENGMDESGALASAHDEVEPQEDEHLYHTRGWTRELWLASLGMPAQLPPIEEEEDVRSAGDAAQAERRSAQRSKVR